MKHKLIALTLLAAALFSCDKNKDDNGPSERTKLLTQQAWLFESAGFDLGSNGTIDPNITSQLPTCLTDNSIAFSNGGNGTVADGATRCNPTDPATTPFTWRFAAGETELHITGNVIPGVNDGRFKIETLSTTQLTLAKDTSYLGLNGKLVASFKH